MIRWHRSWRSDAAARASRSARCPLLPSRATTEAAQPSRVRLPRRGGSGTGRRGPGGPSRGLTPLLRLLGAVIVLVALLVVFGLAIQSCAGTSKHDEYSGYMDDVAKIAHGSQDDGQAVSNALTS